MDIIIAHNGVVRANEIMDVKVLVSCIVPSYMGYYCF